ncbi:hypothetical protein KKG45_13800 [bacterium]|nr:hypothetical protein [bacterium]MBU1074315.1 hypothetical protein [bacterium]MBU1674155.1 hypothetical protein [bacterium]
MVLEVTRDIVSDLWPLYRCGEASTDSRRMVDAYLAADRDFAARLRESDRLTGAMPAYRLSPDAELRMLHDARERARMKMILIGGVITLGGIALLGALSLAFFRFSG